MNTSYPFVQFETGCVDLCVNESWTPYKNTSHTLPYETRHALWSNSKEGASTYVCVNESWTPDINESLAPYINESRTLTYTHVIHSWATRDGLRQSMCVCERFTNSWCKWVTNSYIHTRHTLSSNSRRAASIYLCVNDSRTPDINESLALYVNESRTLSHTQNASLILYLAPHYELVHIWKNNI